MAESLENYFSLDGTKELIADLKSLGLKMKPSQPKIQAVFLRAKPLSSQAHFPQ